MRWKTGRRSSNVEDRRGGGLGDGSMTGGRRKMRVGRRTGIGGGLGTIILVLVAMYFGVDLTSMLQVGGQMDGGGQQAPATSSQFPTGGQLPGTGAQQIPGGVRDEMSDFVSVVLGDTEDTWNAVFNEANARYQEPKLVLYTGMTRSACGLGKAAMGPFYCPGDQKVYIDLAFYDDLKRDYGAPGDFAQAYVIAHEIGHHVQNLLGISDKVEAARRRAGKVEGNQLSVRLELQADCFAGIWANHADRARHILEQGDVEEALTAASAIGDDRLQKQSRGYVTPDSFTHGSSAQRVRWFKTGLRSGKLADCDTFSAERL